jgi:phosphatidylserine decarboxylase
MYTTLLFQESPLIGIIIIVVCLITVIYKYYYVFCIALLLLIVLMVFYRYKQHNKRYDNNTIVSPADGSVIYVEQNGDLVNISIYLNFLSNHTQIYPVNGVVTERIYDKNGKFELANNLNKSRYNEKKIHTIKMENNNIIKVSQIAGFFVRRIVSSKKVPEKVMAGEYLGMIKFGSRVDLEFTGNISNIRVKLGEKINIGDIIYNY